VAVSVRIEDEAFADERYEDLALYAGLADSDHARGKMARIWRQCTLEGTHVVPNQIPIRVLGSNAIDALVRARLAEIVDSDHVRIRGTEGRIEWLSRLRANGKYGKRGGRPKKEEESDKTHKGYTDETLKGGDNKTPPAPAPAPIKDKEESQGDIALATMLVLRILKNNPRHKISTLSESDKDKLLRKWATHVRLMREADGRTYEEIKRTIDWSQAHSFWCSNILSTKKLREKWDTMHAQMTRGPAARVVRAEPTKTDKPRQVMLDGVLVDA
jgi:hypothetical protein